MRTMKGEMEMYAMKRGGLLLAAFVALTLCSGSMICAETYYVSPYGLDGADGLTEHTAWASINYGDQMDLLEPGDTVIVLEGEYEALDRNGFVIENCGGSAEGGPITYKADGVVLVQGHPWDYAYDHGIQILGDASYTVIDGFEFNRARSCINIGGVSNVTIRNCTIRAGWWWGVQAWVTNDVTIINNLFMPQSESNNYGYARSAWSSNTLVAHNTFIGGDGRPYAFVSDRQTEGTHTPAVFKNNITTGFKTAAISLVLDPDWPGLPPVHENNIYFNNYRDFAWTGAAYGSGEFAANPMLDAEYKLTPGSPAIDSGVDLEIGIPYSGAAPDLGAFESEYTIVRGYLEGVVTSLLTGEPLPGIRIWNADGSMATFSKADGTYWLPLPVGADQTIHAGAPGRGIASTAVVDIAASATTYHNFITPPAGRYTFYVKPDGNDAADGLTPATAWQSINNGDLLEKVIPGDTVLVMEGTYEAPSADGIIINKCAGNSVDPITYKADGAVTVIGMVGNHSRGLAFSGNAKYIVVDGFKFERVRRGMELSQAHYMTIKNCTFHVGWWDGLATWRANYCTFHNNLFLPSNESNNWGAINNMDSGFNRIYNNTFIGGTGYPFAIANQRWAYSTEVKNNTITGYPTGIVLSLPGETYYGQVPTHEYNLYYNNTANWGWDGAALGVGELEADPLLDANYRLTAGSPAIDQGIAVGLPFQGTAPDIGAFEFAPSTPVASVGDLLAMSDGTLVALQQAVATVSSGTFSNNMIFVQDESRAAGVAIVLPAGAPAITEGNVVAITGTLKTVEGVRLIEATGVSVVGALQSPLAPLGTSGRSVAGIGLSNEGILLRIWGKVTFAGADYLVIDDGSGRLSSGGHAGVVVSKMSLTNPITVTVAQDQYVLVTGVCTKQDVGSGIDTVVLVRGDADIQ